MMGFLVAIDQRLQGMPERRRAVMLGIAFVCAFVAGYLLAFIR